MGAKGATIRASTPVPETGAFLSPGRLYSVGHIAARPGHSRPLRHAETEGHAHSVSRRRYARGALQAHRGRHALTTARSRWFQGVYVSATTLEACREELREVLEEWVLLRVSRRLTLPAVDGHELRITEVA